MNRIDIGPNIIVQGSTPSCFREEKISKFSFFVPMFQTCDPQGGAQFDPMGII